MALEVCRSTSPHASEVGRARNRPICNYSLANNALRTTSIAYYPDLASAGSNMEIHGAWRNVSAPGLRSQGWHWEIGWAINYAEVG